MLIGWLGMGLPPGVALFGALLSGHGIQRSISAYYYTGARDVFVGVLVSTATFLFAFRGYTDTNEDRIAARVAGVGALGVGLVPTTPIDRVATVAENVAGGVHHLAAVIMFGAYVYFARSLFTRSDQDALPPEKLKRNAWYRRLANAMLVCLLSIAAYQGLRGLELAPAMLDRLNPVFWLEWIAIWAFALSWLIKAGAQSPAD
jgi:hypothetical protein